MTYAIQNDPAPHASAQNIVRQNATCEDKDLTTAKTEELAIAQLAQTPCDPASRKKIQWKVLIYGAAQIAIGTSEVMVGSTIVGTSYTNGGLALPIGWAIIIHGTSTAAAGVHIIVSQEYKDSLMSMCLQDIGISKKTANNIDEITTLLLGLAGQAVIAPTSCYQKILKQQFRSNSQGKVAALIAKSPKAKKAIECLPVFVSTPTKVLVLCSEIMQELVEHGEINEHFALKTILKAMQIIVSGTIIGSYKKIALRWIKKISKK